MLPVYMRLPGGFVGVDIFFVISGYLISSIVFSEISQSRFSVVSFYERRIRRIFPALFAMLAVCSIVATFYLFPTELVEYGKSVLAATFSASNFFFWQRSGYFDSPATKPMLHTWSLAVEEQFYILFPIFLVIVRKFFPRYLRIGVVFFFFASLAASAIIVPYDSITAFYMPYTRAWELLLGTIISLGGFPRINSAWGRNVTAFLGVGLIAYSVLVYTDHTPFPGLSALVPCLGSALIIGTGESGDSLPAKVLSWRPVVFIGLISYSLYLWHWPVIVLFWKMAGFDSLGHSLSAYTHGLLRPTPCNLLATILISFVLAVLSWKFVEQPFRKGPLRMGGVPLFASAFASMALIAALAASFVFSSGLQWRFSPRSVQLASYLELKDNFMRDGTCFITSVHQSTDNFKDSCLRQDAGKKNFLLIGDSHSAMLWSALQSTFPNVNFLQASASECTPFIHSTGAGYCVQLMNYIYQSYLPSHPVQGILICDRWKEKNLPDLAETLQWATQHQLPVVLIGPVPEYDSALPRLLAYAVNRNQPAFTGEHRLKELEELDAKMQDLAATAWHVPYVSLYQAICDHSECREYADDGGNIPLMTDADHLSRPGAMLVVRQLARRGKFAGIAQDGSPVKGLVAANGE